MGYAIAAIRANFPLYATTVTIAHYLPLDLNLSRMCHKFRCPLVYEPCLGLCLSIAVIILTGLSYKF